MEVVRSVLEETARAASWRVPTREPVVLLLEFASSSVEWETSVWIADPWQMRRLRSHLNEEIWNALRRNGIAIAFPQLDVHVDQEVVRLLRGGSSPA
jgi:small-conductance mechanosensitive channel